MRATTAILVSAVLVAACGQAPRSGPAPGDPILFIAVSTPAGQAVDLVDAKTHTTTGHLPPGASTSDWKHYYVVSGSILEDVVPLTGSFQRSLPLPAPYKLPVLTAGGLPGGLSQDGRWLVLQQQGDGTSHLLRVQTSFDAPPVRVDIPGDFTFDAISNDGSRIYLIQHAAAGHYFVRDYLIGSGLDPYVIVDKSDGAAAMSGVRLMGVAAPGGSTLYSVYARADQSAFVHELSLDAPFAVCADLSGPGYGADRRAMTWTLALSPAGDRLVAVNSALGLVSEVIAPGGAPRTVHIGAAPASIAGAAVFTHDGTRLMVAGAAGIRWLDASTLQTVAIALQPWNVAGITLSADGKTVYAVSAPGQVAELDSTGRVVATFEPGLGTPWGLMGVMTVT